MKAPKDQHFLVDQNAVERIAGLVEVKGRVVLEIGPGTGVLTRALLSRGAHVRAIELDRELFSYLSELFTDEIALNKLELLNGDATKCEFPPFEIVISNLPYSASSKITFRLLNAGFESAVLMYQSEFAKRMLAPVGTPECGRLSVMVQTFACVERCFELSPKSFSPQPQVRSMVVKIHPREPIFPIQDRKLYADVVRALFSHRRKTVKNCLRGSSGMLEKDMVEHLLSDIPREILTSRPEELYLEDFATITNMGMKYSKTRTIE
ncbi:MAG: 16S rRNA (adenine(1518)-N(6)/adenine(1519)-N(6))-dimethyltransferase RsmA [Methanomicrobiales archaeon]